ncbi:PilZ domain-containing protein [Candidatus Nitrospira bockiana]
MTDRRRAPRYAAAGWVSFTGEDVVSSGQLVNLSLGGCLVGGSVPMRVGTRLALTVQLERDREPIEVEMGTVQWVSGYRFGIEFLIARTEDMARLRSYLSRHVANHPGTG